MGAEHVFYVKEGEENKTAPLDLYPTPRSLVHLVYDKMEELYGDSWLDATKGRVLDLCTGGGMWMVCFMERYAPSEHMTTDLVRYPTLPRWINFAALDLELATPASGRGITNRGHMEKLLPTGEAFALEHGTFNIVLSNPPYGDLNHTFPERAMWLGKRLLHRPNGLNFTDGFMVFLLNSTFAESSARYNRIFAYNDVRPSFELQMSDRWSFNPTTTAGHPKSKSVFVWRGLGNNGFMQKDFVIRPRSRRSPDYLTNDDYSTIADSPYPPDPLLWNGFDHNANRRIK